MSQLNNIGEQLVSLLNDYVYTYDQTNKHYDFQKETEHIQQLSDFAKQYNLDQSDVSLVFQSILSVARKHRKNK